MNNNTVVLTTLLNGEQAAKELESLRVKAKTLAMTIDDAEKKGNYAFAKQMKKDLTDTNREINKLQRQTIDVNHILKNLSTAKPTELRQAFQALNRQLDNKSIQRNSKQWDEINAKMKLVRAEMQKVRTESVVSEGFFSRFANGFNKYFASVMSVVGMVTGASLTFRKLSQDAAKMEDTYADVMKTTGMTREAVGELNEEFKRMDTRTAREELNNLARDAGKLGLSSKKDILDFVEAGNQINVALGEDLGEGAIRNIGKMSEVFRNSTRELDQMDLKGRMLSIGSAINELGQSSTASEAYLVNFTQRLGGVASQADISIPNVLGYASALDQSGQAVEMSATAIQKFIMNLMGEPAKYARIAGLEVEAFSKLLKEDTNEAIKTVLRSLSEKGGFQQLIPIFKEMGLDGARAVGVLSALATNIDKVDEAQRIANDSFREATSLTDEYNVKNENAAAELEKRKKAFKDAAEELGRRLNPALLKSTNYVTYLVKLLPGFLDFLGKYGKYILYLATAYAAYTAGVKFSVMWNDKFKETLTLNNLLLRAKAGFLAAVRIAMLAYNVVIALVTGNITRMRAAWKLLTAAMATNPIGMIAVAATAAIAGIIKMVQWLNRTKSASEALVDVNKRLADSVSRERAELDLLLGIAKNEKISKEERLKAIRKLNEISPEYLQNLNLENINTDAARISVDKYTKALMENARQKAVADKMSELYSKKLANEAKIAEEQARYDAQAPGSEIKRFAYNEIQRIEKENAKLDKQLAIYQSLGEKISENKTTKSNAYADSWVQLNREIELLNDLEKQHAAIYEKAGNQSTWGGSTEFSDKAQLTLLAQRIERQKELIKKKEEELKVISKIIKTESGDDSPGDGDGGAVKISNSNPLKDREEALKNSYQRQILDLKNNLLDRTITEEEYQRKAYVLQIAHLFEMMRVRKDFKADTLDLEMQLTDNMLDEANRRYKLIADIQKKSAADLKNRQGEEAIDEDYSPQNFHDEKMLLDLRHEYGMITEKEYQQALSDLREEYLNNYLAKYLDVSRAIQDISADLSGAIDGFQRAEEMSVSRKYDKMIKAAGNNSKKAAQLEEEKEDAIHKVRSKYADKQFVITVANVIASTATAAMESYKAMAGIPVVGPALGAAAAAAAILYGGGQIAIAKQQRDAAKEGYADGGYTKKGNWWEVDGMVHKNEFVGNRYAVANPTVRKVFDVVDQAQRNNTIGSLSERDFQTALNYNEHTQRRIMSDAIAGIMAPAKYPDQSGMISILTQLAAVNNKLTEQLNEPIVAETYIEGKGGSKQANDYYSKMKKNVTRS